MKQLKEIVRRIRSVKNTRQITRAMEMVSAARLRKVEKKVLKGKRYYGQLKSTLHNHLARLYGEAHPFFQAGTGEKELLLVIAGERGLCGSYNTAILDRAMKWANEDRAGRSFMVAGRRGQDKLRAKGFTLDRSWTDIKLNILNQVAEEIRSAIVKGFNEGLYSSVHVLYTSYFSAVKKDVTVEQLLPLEFSGEPEADDFTYEPSKAGVIGTLASRFVEVSILHALTEAMASEFSSRMVAMKSATDNADEMLDKLILDKNRARQAAITTEITEIASGAEALK